MQKTGSDHEVTAASGAENGLSLRGIGVTYALARTGAELTATVGVDLTVARGEFVAIVGPSGCGKTTLLNLVAGLLYDYRGEAHFGGRRIDGPGRERAVVFQSPSLLPWRTVHANIAYGLELQGAPRAEIERRVDRYLRMVGLQGFAGSYPRELSGGMQQRVNLARALVMDPQILLMDEPFAALDAQTRELMQEELLQIWLKARKTVLFITHQIDEAIFLSDRVVVFTARPGRVRHILPVGLERPRRLSLKRDARFQAIEDEVWTLIQEEARRGGSEAQTRT
jgi:NitT/TauT family transport system ATP-binding protein